jgi:formylglycine-generating enzyme required for sulfatase activity
MAMAEESRRQFPFFPRMNPDPSHSEHLPLHPPAWADKFGEDDFGIFACFFVGKVEFEFRWIPPGSFLMGSPDGRDGRERELGRYDDEGPQVERAVAGFWLGTTPVTQAQWGAMRDDNPSRFNEGGQFPVENVDWRQARDFAAEVSLTTGAPFSLPEERQWEYACRAGTTSALHTGQELTTEHGKCPNLDEIAWYDQNSASSTHEVGEKLPNAWGLHDMLGNVWEWCADPWDPEAYAKLKRGEPALEGVENAKRVVRGGSWIFRAGRCRAACRDGGGPGRRWSNLGFRLAAGQEPGAAEPPGSGATLP